MGLEPMNNRSAGDRLGRLATLPTMIRILPATKCDHITLEITLFYKVYCI